MAPRLDPQTPARPTGLAGLVTLLLLGQITPQLPPPAPPRALPAIRPGRAWAETTGLFIIVFGPSVLTAARTGFGPAWLGWWDRWYTEGTQVAFAAGLVWLAWATFRGSRRPAAVTGLVAAVAAVAAVAVVPAVALRWFHHQPTAAYCLYYASWVALTVLLVALLARRRGLDTLGFGVGRQPGPGPGHGWRAAWARGWDIVQLSWAGMLIPGFLAMGMAAVTGVHGPPNVLKANGLDHAASILAATVHAGICEELVMVATLVTALEAARRPAWQIYTAGLTLRLAIHLYFGPTVICVAVMAATQIWLFRRTRRILPLIIAHTAFDLIGAARLLYGWAGLAAVAVLLIASTLIGRSSQDPQDCPAHSCDDTDVVIAGTGGVAGGQRTMPVDRHQTPASEAGR